jgi:hypothetical protein
MTLQAGRTMLCFLCLLLGLPVAGFPWTREEPRPSESPGSPPCKVADHEVLCPLERPVSPAGKITLEVPAPPESVPCANPGDDICLSIHYRLTVHNAGSVPLHWNDPGSVGVWLVTTGPRRTSLFPAVEADCRPLLGQVPYPSESARELAAGQTLTMSRTFQVKVSRALLGEGPARVQFRYRIPLRTLDREASTQSPGDSTAAVTVLDSCHKVLRDPRTWKDALVSNRVDLEFPALP